MATPVVKVGGASEMQEKSVFLGISLGLHYFCSMKGFWQLLRRFVPPYKKYIVLNVLFNLLAAAGPDNTDFTYWTEEQQTAFWDGLEAAAEPLAQDIVDYVESHK